VPGIGKVMVPVVILAPTEQAEKLKTGLLRMGCENVLTSSQKEIDRELLSRAQGAEQQAVLVIYHAEECSACAAAELAEAHLAQPEALIWASAQRQPAQNAWQKMSFSLLRGVVRFVLHSRVEDIHPAAVIIPAERVEDYAAWMAGKGGRAEKILRGCRSSKCSVVEKKLDCVRTGKKGPAMDAWSDMLRILWQMISFILSAGASTIVDYALFSLLLYGLKQPMWLSYALARACSAVLNFYLNRKVVFKSSRKDGAAVEFIKYALLAAAVLVVGNVATNLLSAFIPPIISKVIADVSLFVVNYFVQRDLIFKTGSPHEKTGGKG